MSPTPTPGFENFPTPTQGRRSNGRAGVVNKSVENNGNLLNTKNSCQLCLFLFRKIADVGNNNI